MGPTITLVVGQLLPRLPVLLVYLAGLILAMRLYGRYPTVCLLTMISLLLLVVLNLVGALAYWYLFFEAPQRAGWSIEHSARLLGILGVASGILQGVAMGLLLAAVFIGRRSPLQIPLAFQRPPSSEAAPPSSQSGSSAFFPGARTDRELPP
jgi:hypothetical protein